jgi:hypothetical protein
MNNFLRTFSVFYSYIVYVSLNSYPPKKNVTYARQQRFFQSSSNYLNLDFIQHQYFNVALYKYSMHILQG